MSVSLTESTEVKTRTGEGVVSTLSAYVATIIGTLRVSVIEAGTNRARRSRGRCGVRIVSTIIPVRRGDTQRRGGGCGDRNGVGGWMTGVRGSDDGSAMDASLSAEGRGGGSSRRVVITRCRNRRGRRAARSTFQNPGGNRDGWDSAPASNGSCRGCGRALGLKGIRVEGEEF